jgi:hypothetical protein
MNSRNCQKKGAFFARLDVMFEAGLKHEKLSNSQICNLFFREVDSDTPLYQIQGSRSIRMMGVHLCLCFHEHENNAKTGIPGQRLGAATGRFLPRRGGFEFRNLVPDVFGDHRSREAGKALQGIVAARNLRYVIAAHEHPHNPPSIDSGAN